MKFSILQSQIHPPGRGSGRYGPRNILNPDMETLHSIVLLLLLLLSFSQQGAFVCFHATDVPFPILITRFFGVLKVLTLSGMITEYLTMLGRNRSYHCEQF